MPSTKTMRVTPGASGQKTGVLVAGNELMGKKTGVIVRERGGTLSLLFPSFRRRCGELDASLQPWIFGGTRQSTCGWPASRFPAHLPLTSVLPIQLLQLRVKTITFPAVPTTVSGNCGATQKIVLNNEFVRRDRQCVQRGQR